MKTILLAAAALTLNAGLALADNGDSFDINSGTGTSAHFMQTVQPQAALRADAPSMTVGQSVSQTRDTRTGSLNDPINWGSG
jgi:hypothetical protein